MAIRGLTKGKTYKIDGQAGLEPGRQNIILEIGKGMRIKQANGNYDLQDLEHFVPRPKVSGKEEAIIRAWGEVYGSQAREIDVLLVCPEGDGTIQHYKPANYAYEKAGRPEKKGDNYYHLATASFDEEMGGFISSYRDEKDVSKYYWLKRGWFVHEDGTVTDGKNGPVVRKDPWPIYDESGFRYDNVVYPWGRELRIPLVLPDLNRHLEPQRIVGLAELVLRGKNDIVAFEEEVIAGLAQVQNALFGNSPSASMSMGMMPLSAIPFTMSRRREKMNRTFVDKESGKKRQTKKDSYNVHFAVSPSFQVQMYKAMGERSQRFLERSAEVLDPSSLLSSGSVPRLSIAPTAQAIDEEEDVNDILFGSADSRPRDIVIGSFIEEDEESKEEEVTDEPLSVSINREKLTADVLDKVRDYKNASGVVFLETEEQGRKFVDWILSDVDSYAGFSNEQVSSAVLDTAVAYVKSLQENGDVKQSKTVARRYFDEALIPF